MAKKPTDKTVTGANLGFEEKLWATADKLRGHMDAAEYKHVVLGLVLPTTRKPVRLSQLKTVPFYSESANRRRQTQLNFK